MRGDTEDIYCEALDNNLEYSQVRIIENKEGMTLQ